MYSLFFHLSTEFILGSFCLFLRPLRLGPPFSTLYTPRFSAVDSGRFSSAVLHGKRPPPFSRLGGRHGLLLGASLACWLRVGFGYSFAVFWQCYVGDSLIMLLRHPVPCPAARPYLLTRFTLLFSCAFSKLRGAPMLWESSEAACGVSFPC